MPAGRTLQTPSPPPAPAALSARLGRFALAVIAVLVPSSVPLAAQEPPCRPCSGLVVGAPTEWAADLASSPRLADGATLYIAWEVPAADAATALDAAHGVADAGAVPWIVVRFDSPSPMPAEAAALDTELESLAAFARRAPREHALPGSLARRVFRQGVRVRLQARCRRPHRGPHRSARRDRGPARRCRLARGALCRGRRRLRRRRRRGPGTRRRAPSLARDPGHPRPRQAGDSRRSPPGRRTMCSPRSTRPVPRATASP